MSQHIDPTPKQTDLNALNSKISGSLASNRIRYTKQSAVVCVAVNLPGVSESQGWNTIETLPTGFRPAYDITFGGVETGTQKAYQFQIDTSGNVKVYALSSGLVYAAGTVSFIAS